MGGRTRHGHLSPSVPRFGRLGTPRWARVAGLAFGCLAPTYIAQESVDFRVWEGGLAACLAALVLDQLLAIRAAAATRGAFGRLGALGGALFCVNPALGLASLAAIALLCLQHLAWQNFWVPAVSGGMTMAALLIPWSIRNERVMHAPVLLRSNAGLELAIAEYPGALAPADRATEFMARLEAVHPSVGAGAYRAMMQAGGEIAYANQLRDETRAWMAAHPLDTLYLFLLHIRQTLLPEEWQFTVFGRSSFAAGRAFLAQLVGFTGTFAIILAIVRRRPHWLYPAVMIGAMLILSAPFQPVKRYTYLVYPILVFAAADLLAGGGARLSRSQSEDSR